MPRFGFYAFLLFVSGLIAPCSATELAHYAFTGASNTSTDTDTATSASTFGFGPAGTNWAISSAQNNAYARGDTTPATAQLAVDNGSYFTFTLTPVSLGSGNGINLTSLTFDTLSNNATNISGSADVTFFVRSSLDHFFADIDNQQFTQAYNSNTVANPVSRMLDMSAYQGIVSMIEFRIYVFDGANDVNRTPRVDNVILSGTISPIPVPEPVTTTLLAGGAMMALALLRRRRT